MRKGRPAPSACLTQTQPPQRLLQVLWVSQCGLQDLHGISSFPQLRELYASYNSVPALESLADTPLLEVLDLEGCEVTDALQLGFLSACKKLSAVVLAHTPVSRAAGYRQAVIAATAVSVMTVDDLEVTADERAGTLDCPSATSLLAGLDSSERVQVRDAFAVPRSGPVGAPTCARASCHWRTTGSTVLIQEYRRSLVAADESLHWAHCHALSCQLVGAVPKCTARGHAARGRAQRQHPPSRNGAAEGTEALLHTG